MARFFYHPHLQAGRTICLSPEESHHLNVTRLRPGSSVLVSDGKGRVFRGILREEEAEGKLVDVEEQVGTRFPSYRLRVCQAFLHSQARLDWQIEKMAELGVTEVCFFPGLRSIPRFSDRRLSRLERLAVEACKQSGRPFFPSFRIFSSWKKFTEFLEVENSMNVVCEPAASSTLPQVLRETKRYEYSLVVGPEGDFTDSEKTDLGGLAHTRFAKLTHAILRSETAALYAASVTISFLENMDENSSENFWL